MTDDELDGVCAINAYEACYLPNSTYSGYSGNIVLILGSNDAVPGEDPREIIMRDAVVLNILNV